MEYPTVEIVGEYQGQAVANPLPFPEPVIYDGALQKLRVQDSGGVIAERACIISNLFIFELGRMLKEAIYGQVHCGCRLETDGDGIFRRTSDLVAVKIISKAKLRQLSDRTQENPLKVIDSPSSSLTSAPPLSSVSSALGNRRVAVCGRHSSQYHGTDLLYRKSHSLL
jgi:hypothetical protein